MALCIVYYTYMYPYMALCIVYYTYMYPYMYQLPFRYNNCLSKSCNMPETYSFNVAGEVVRYSL